MNGGKYTMQIPNINSADFDMFDPYSIFDNSINMEVIKQLGLDFVVKGAEKPLYKLITQGDPVFSINDMAISGLVAIWKANTRKKNKLLLLNLIRFYVNKKNLDIELGLYTFIIFSGLRIGMTMSNWYKQLGNPIRSSVITKFITNIPKTISKGGNYFENVGWDLIEENRKVFIYYFNELNKNIILFIYLTSYYLHKDANNYIKRFVEKGYKWLQCSSPYAEDVYEFLFKFHIPNDIYLFYSKSIADIYLNFKIYKKDLKTMYKEIDCMEENYKYVEKNAEYFLESFDEFVKKDNESC